MHIRAVHQYFDGKNRGYSTIPDGGFAQLYLDCSGTWHGDLFIGRVPLPIQGPCGPYIEVRARALYNYDISSFFNRGWALYRI